jgi:hypothetical protein
MAEVMTHPLAGEIEALASMPLAELAARMAAHDREHRDEIAALVAGLGD